jgi:hypothetical protein
VTSTLTFVDLAGSEDILKSGATGMTAREASHINKSLLTLGRVINALACNEKHIPYRDSKLTRLLSEALGGVCKTSFIANCSLAASSSVETGSPKILLKQLNRPQSCHFFVCAASTLRYAENAMQALNVSQLPKWKRDEIMIDGLTRRVQQLLDQLALQDRVHKEDMDDMVAQRNALQAENDTQRVQLYQQSRKVLRPLCLCFPPACKDSLALARAADCQA